MSTSALQTELSPAWKEEVNRRVAAHRSRKGVPPGGPAPLPERPAAAGRAASAAARVAARYANAPSYSELLQEEARAAVRAAEQASRAAREAQAKAEQVLAGLEMTLQAAPVMELQWVDAVENSAPSPRTPALGPISSPVAAPASGLAWDRPGQPAHKAASIPDSTAGKTAVQAQPQPAGPADFAVRWAEDLPARSIEARPVHAGPAHDERLWEETAEEIAMVEAALPIHGNVIEFPRELVAPRKARPRLIEGPYGTPEHDAQLSIFEVHPEAISTEPAAAAVLSEPAAWPAPEWTGMELAAETPHSAEAQSAAEEGKKARAAHLAPAGWRLLAAVVDAALITGAVAAAALAAAVNTPELPPLRQVQLGGAVALPVFGALYMVLFLVLSSATPGMRYAGVSLRTFDERTPGPVRRCGRLLAMALSLVPLGLGTIWAIFDEEHLSWHDRLSGTYLRRG